MSSTTPAPLRAATELLEIVQDVEQHIEQGKQSEAFLASQYPDYGTGVFTHIARQMSKVRAILSAPAPVAHRPVTDEEIEAIAKHIWGAQAKRLPMASAIMFARFILNISQGARNEQR